MKQTGKMVRRVMAGLFLLGLTLRCGGAVMGGRKESRRYEGEVLENWRWGAVQIGPNGIAFGGPEGLIIDSSGIRFGDGRLTILSKGPTDFGEEEKIRESGDLTGITGVDVDIDCGDIHIRTGESFSAVLTWNLGKYAMDYHVDNGVLKVESEGDEEIFGQNDFEIISKVVITLPAGAELHELDLSTEFGDIFVEADGAMAWEAELDTSLGDVDCFGLTARELKVESSLGDVTVHFPQKEGVGYHLLSQMGIITVNGAEFQGDWGECETSYTTQDQTYFIEASTSLGDVQLLY